MIKIYKAVKEIFYPRKIKHGPGLREQLKNIPNVIYVSKLTLEDLKKYLK